MKIDATTHYARIHDLYLTRLQDRKDADHILRLERQRLERLNVQRVQRNRELDNIQGQNVDVYC